MRDRIEHIREFDESTRELWRSIMNRWKIVASLVLGGLVLSFVPVSAVAEDNAVVKGKVLFKGDPEKYKRTPLDTAKDANCTKKIGSEQVVLNKKADPITIKYVVVSIKEGLGDRKVKPKAEG